MSRFPIITAIALVAGCSSSPATQAARLDKVAFDVPVEWKRTDTTVEKLRAVVWTPETNARKESVTVIRTERTDPSRFDERTSLRRLLVSAHAGTGTLRASPVTDVVTEQGLTGSRIEADILAGPQNQRYRRVHVVLVDGAGPSPALIHVIYTAANPDRDLTELNLVLRTVRREEV